MNFIVPLIFTIVGFVFAITVLDQFIARGKPYQLIWVVGLLMYFITTGSVLLRNKEVFESARFPLIHGLGRITDD